VCLLRGQQNTEQLIVQRSQVFICMRDKKSYQRKNYALIAQVQDIALMSVRANLRCQICDRKHHTFICHKQGNKTSLLLVAAGISFGNVTYPVAVVEVEGIECRTLLDTCSGSS